MHRFENLVLRSVHESQWTAVSLLKTRKNVWAEEIIQYKYPRSACSALNSGLSQFQLQHTAFSFKVGRLKY